MLKRQPLFERSAAEASRPGTLSAELDFYQAYGWCLDPYRKVNDTIRHLSGEIDRLETVPDDWRSREVATNVMLLSCALLNATDEYLRGPTLRLPRRLAATPLGQGARWTVDTAQSLRHHNSRRRARRWRDALKTGLHAYLMVFIGNPHADRIALAQVARALASLLTAELPDELRAGRIGIPSAFRRLDLTHLDILALGQRYVQRFPDRSEPVVLVGLRTGGSYFAPVLHAVFDSEGFTNVSSMTIQPNTGLGQDESRELGRCVRRGSVAIIVDDPPMTANTLLLAFDLVHRAGLAQDKIRLLAPTHEGQRHWFKHLSRDGVVTLEPEQWHTRQLLEPSVAQDRIADYYRAQGFVRAGVVASERAVQLNTGLNEGGSNERGARLKRIYEVQLESAGGKKTVRYVVAKSAGWGWFGYHAFLVAHRLSGFVAPMLGLRDGLLFMEWIPQPGPRELTAPERNKQIDASASYVATRVRYLGLDARRQSGKSLIAGKKGTRLLETVLSKAYGRVLTDALNRPRLGRRLGQLPCPVPTLIDGRMGRCEWIAGSGQPLKTDFEHHGLGKAELDVTDPAYDLAETILSLDLSPAEENRLLGRYVAESEDTGIGERLFLNKLLAGLWTMNTAQARLFGKPHATARQEEYHRLYMSAWHFLTVQTARHCGSLIPTERAAQWRSPLVATDIDGVLDRRLFGFPSTSAAGLEALAVLASHRLTVALNSARSASEIREYCQAYSLAGGVAEYGSYLYDAVGQCEKVLVSPQALSQLAELRTHLQRLPGVFLDDRHQYSIRALTYVDRSAPANRGLIPSLLTSSRGFSVGNGIPAPLPALTVNHLLATLELDKLTHHHTTIDTTFVAKDVDKGTGLQALRDWVMGEDAEVFAIGDSQPDLAMFKVATRSFAPRNISCSREARLLGCSLSRFAYQRGLLDIARRLAHPDGGRCERCAGARVTPTDANSLFLDLLKASDATHVEHVLRPLFDPQTYCTLVR